MVAALGEQHVVASGLVECHLAAIELVEEVSGWQCLEGARRRTQCSEDLRDVGLRHDGEVNASEDVRAVCCGRNSGVGRQCR